MVKSERWMDGTKTTKMGGMTHMPRVSTTVVLFNKIRVVLWIKGSQNENDQSLYFLQVFMVKVESWVNITKKTKMGGMPPIARVSTIVVLFKKIRVVLWIKGSQNEND